LGKVTHKEEGRVRSLPENDEQEGEICFEEP